MTIQDLARECCPPVLWCALRAVRDRVRPPVPEWEYVPDGWAAAKRLQVRGWTAAQVAARAQAEWPALVAAMQAPRAVGLSSEAVAATDATVGTHNLYLAFAYVLARSALARTSASPLTVLDYGSGLPTYYALARQWYPALPLDYTCLDLPAIAAAGGQVAPAVTYHADPEAAFARRYDLVFASSATQYTEDQDALFARLARSTAGALYITRIPVVEHAPDYVLLQRAHRYGYATEYLGWVLNRPAFIARLAKLGLVLEREFLLDERPTVAGAPEPPAYRGFLFRPATAAV